MRLPGISDGATLWTVSSLSRVLLILAFLALPWPLAACGAGIISGAVASNGGNGGGGAPPTLSLPTQAMPLSPIPSVLARTVVIANAAISAGATLQVLLRVPGPQGPDGRPTYLVTANQTAPVLLSGQGTSTVVGFDLATSAIVAVTTAAADVAAQIAVLADGREVAPPLAVTLLAQPRVRLLDGAPVFVSALGGQVVRLACSSLRSIAASGLAVSVTTADATGLAPTVTRPCLRPFFAVHDPDRDPPLLAGERLVTAEVPGNTFVGAATFLVDDAIAGRSVTVAGAYYQPEVQVALPAQGSTRGGTKVTLIGRALLPLAAGVSPGEPDFDALRVQLRKGDRIVDLDPSAVVREGSSLDRLVFFTPPSPDGRPGDVGIALRVTIAAPPKPLLTAEVVARGVFLFANPEPVFGPRGALLDRDPIAVAPISLEGAPASTQATDFAVLYSIGGAAAVQLLAAQENGLFIRFGPTRRIGDPEQAADRSPRDLLSGDFDRDGIPDLLILNEGAAAATLHLVRGQRAPAAPLGLVQRLPCIPGMVKGRVADFDGDGGPDVVLLPGGSASPGQGPVLLRSRVVAGEVSFLPAVAVPVRDYDYDAFEVADFDGDGALDIGVIAGGLLQQIDVAYGDGGGGFAGTALLNFTVPRAGYQPSARSPAVGLHAVGGSPCALTVVLAGLPPLPFSTPPGPAENPTTPPVILLVRPASARIYQQPIASDVLQLVGAIDPFRASLAVNLDGDGAGADELLVGSTGALGQFSLGLFRYDAALGLRVVRVVVDFRPTQVAAFFVGVAFPADPVLQQPSRAGVFVQHELSVDGELERRLSTLLVSRDAADLLLLSPDVVFPVPLAGVIGGRFSEGGLVSDGSVRDVAVPSATQIQLGSNDGFGALSPGRMMVHPGLVPETAAQVPQLPGATDLIAFVDDGGRDGRSDGMLRIGFWQPDPQGLLVQTPTLFSGDIRPFLPTSLRNAAIDSSSHILVADVDSDGRLDLTALLRFVGFVREGESMLLLMRGIATNDPGDYPFEQLQQAAFTATSGGASSLVLADFAADSNLIPVRLELAMTVPTDSAPGAGDGNHVRFYRLNSGGGGVAASWVRSFDATGARALATGNAPTRLAAADFDRSGTVDLMVACDGDASLRVYLNSGLPAASVDEVAVGAFNESFGSPLSTGLGRHTYLLLGDINGDGTVDALLATESTLANGQLSTQVVFHLSAGSGEFENGIRVSPTRLGNRNARLSIDLGDINRDAVPDLTLGWFQGGTQNDNLLVLLGGSL